MKAEGGRKKRSSGSNHAGKSDFHPPSFILHRSKRRFGQNFLVDRSVADRIIAAVNPAANDTIVEIGPGRGALTSLLSERVGRLIAIEFDRDLVPRLREQFGASANL